MNPVVFLVISIIVVSFLILLLIFSGNSVKNIQSATISSPHTLNSRMWQSTVSGSPLKITFPELCTSSNYGIIKPNLDKVSLAISGGGSVAFGCSIGFFRALNRMGYKNKAQYVSTVSGGSWFYGVYSYCQSNSYLTDDRILGLSTGCLTPTDIPNPAKMTISALKDKNKSNTLYYGHIFTNKELLLCSEQEGESCAQITTAKGDARFEVRLLLNNSIVSAKARGACRLRNRNQESVAL
jgi:hypothetical protein